MSDHFLVVIPSDPDAPLPEDGGQALCSALVKIADSEEARVKSYDGRVQFIDCGENFETVSCPACGASLDMEWWGDQMDHCWDADERRFSLHPHSLPCCSASKALNELTYTFPQGFASWFVSARNVNRGPLTQEELSELEAVAGRPLSAITQMY